MSQWHSVYSPSILLRTLSLIFILLLSELYRYLFTGRKLIIYNRTSPDKFELAGKVELLTFILTFLSSTWYIKNPFLKSKINDVSSPTNVFGSLVKHFAGLIHEYLGLRSRKKRRTGQHVEYPSFSLETSNVVADALLHR